MRLRAHTDSTCGDHVLGVFIGTVHTGLDGPHEVREFVIEVVLIWFTITVSLEYYRKAKPPKWKTYKASMGKQRREPGNGLPY